MYISDKKTSEKTNINKDKDTTNKSDNDNLLVGIH